MTHNQLKKCYVCKEYKPLTEFHRNKSKKDGLSNLCKKCAIAYQAEYRERTVEKRKAYRHKYYLAHRDVTREKNDRWMKEHQEQYDEWVKSWRKRTREHRNKLRREWHRREVKNNPVYVSTGRVRCLIRQSIRKNGYSKGTKTAKILGCDFNTFWEHLLQTWEDNYGNPWAGEEYDIDHIVPLATAKTEKDVIKLCHYTNLQMLTPKDNRKKWYKYDT